MCLQKNVLSAICLLLMAETTPAFLYGLFLSRPTTTMSTTTAKLEIKQDLSKSTTIKSNTSTTNVVTSQTPRPTTTSPPLHQPLCVCTSHTVLNIYSHPDHRGIIGSMYGDCKPYANRTKDTFYTVVHYQQIGFVQKDALTHLVSCPDDFIPDAMDIITTAASLTDRCDKMAIFKDIAHTVTVDTLHADQCPDGSHNPGTEAVEVFCSAPDPLAWNAGIQVMGNCNAIQKYSPIAVFDTVSKSIPMAGVLLSCNSSSLEMAAQSCTSNLHIHQVTALDSPSSGSYHVVEW